MRWIVHVLQRPQIYHIMISMILLMEEIPNNHLGYLPYQLVSRISSINSCLVNHRLRPGSCQRSSASQRQVSPHGSLCRRNPHGNNSCIVHVQISRGNWHGKWKPLSSGFPSDYVPPQINSGYPIVPCLGLNQTVPNSCMDSPWTNPPKYLFLASIIYS